jgi:hypothetical protein
MRPAGRLAIRGGSSRSRDRSQVVDPLSEAGLVLLSHAHALLSRVGAARVGVVFAAKPPPAAAAAHAADAGAAADDAAASAAVAVAGDAGAAQPVTALTLARIFMFLDNAAGGGGGGSSPDAATAFALSLPSLLDAEVELRSPAEQGQEGGTGGGGGGWPLRFTLDR